MDTLTQAQPKPKKPNLAASINFLAGIIKRRCPTTPHFTSMGQKTAMTDGPLPRRPQMTRGRIGQMTTIKILTAAAALLALTSTAHAGSEILDQPNVQAALFGLGDCYTDIILKEPAVPHSNNELAARCMPQLVKWRSVCLATGTPDSKCGAAAISVFQTVSHDTGGQIVHVQPKAQRGYVQDNAIIFGPNTSLDILSGINGSIKAVFCNHNGVSYQSASSNGKARIDQRCGPGGDLSSVR
jgi:hypothetical protein